jgi:predicted nucleic-acid-binding protein
MVAVDTNIIVRLLTEDDQVQFKKSLSLFERNEIFIPDTVILETEWVLRYAYEFDAEAIQQGFIKLFGLENVQLAEPMQIAQALEWYASGLDFADALHLAKSQHLSHLYTFDKAFINKSNKLSNCLVADP